MDTLEHIEGLQELQRREAEVKVAHEGDSVNFLRIAIRMHNIRALIADLDIEEWLVIAKQHEDSLAQEILGHRITQPEWQILYCILHGKSIEEEATAENDVPVYPIKFPVTDRHPAA